MTYDAVVFDYDGVLMEPTPRAVLVDAVREAFTAVGVDPDDTYLDDLLVNVDYDVLQAAAAHYGMDAEAFWVARDRAFADHQAAYLEAGGKRLYDDHVAIRDVTLPCGLVSSNQQATIDHHLAYTGLTDRFVVVYGREPHPDSLRRKKPNPHYIHRALAALDTTNALYVGDLDSDVQAARNAGIDSAYVRRPHNGPPGVEPTHEIDSLHDLHDLLA